MQNSEIGRERSCRHPVRAARIVGREERKASPLMIHRDELSYTVLSDVRFYFSLHRIPVHKKAM